MVFWRSIIALSDARLETHGCVNARHVWSTHGKFNFGMSRWKKKELEEQKWLGRVLGESLSCNVLDRDSHRAGRKQKSRQKSFQPHANLVLRQILRINSLHLGRADVCHRRNL